MMKYMSLVLHECINDQTDDHFPLVDKPPGQVGGVGITRATVHYLEPHPCTVYPRRVLVPWSRAILGGVLQILCYSEIASAVSSAGKLRSSPAKADCYCLVTQLCCLFATPWTAARQASLSSTLSQSLLRLMSIESMMPSSSSSVIPFYSCLESFPASGSFPMLWFFTSGGQSFGAASSASVLPVNIQG